MLRGDEWIGTGDEPERRPRQIPIVPEPHRQERRKRPGRGLLGPIVRTVIAVLVVGGAGIAAYVMNREELPPPIETAHYQNPDAGYSFDYPRSWELREEGTTATVLHPTRQALVSFGVGPNGSAQEASDQLIGEIRRSQQEVEAGEPVTRRLAGRPAIMVAGTAKNKGGEAIEFLAVTVHAANRNFLIVLYAAVDADPEQIVAPTRAMLASFEPPGG